jgi:MFS family permease
VPGDVAVRRRLAFGLAAVGPLLIVAGIALGVAGTDHYLHDKSPLSATLGVAFAVVGALIASRESRNPIGWVFLAASVATGLSAVTNAYAAYWLEGNGSATLGKAAAVYASAGWMPFILLPTTFVLLLFPNGEVLGPRWRKLIWIDAVTLFLGFVGALVTVGPLEDYPQVENPIGVKALSDLLAGPGLLGLFGAVVASAVSLVLRYRRSSGVERRQIEWLAFAGAVAGVVIPIATLGGDVIWNTTVTNNTIMLAVLGLPIATGVAILRYRLYDIDVVINRTLVYGGLTATLAAAYLGSVLLLQLVLSGLTGGSGLAVAASTLAVAALFRPARARIQDAVDRRFFRRKYDAARTLETFTARLRDQVSLDALTDELRDVVTDTMQPAHVSIWMRGPAA